jgi:hypothetical protein
MTLLHCLAEIKEIVVGSATSGILLQLSILLKCYSGVRLRFLISLLVLRLGLVVLKVAIFFLSLSMWVGAAFSLLRL